MCELQMSEMTVKMFEKLTSKHRVTCHWRLLLCKASKAACTPYELTQRQHFHMRMHAASVTVCAYICMHSCAVICGMQPARVRQRIGSTKINQKEIHHQKFATKLILATTSVACQYCCKWQQWNQCGNAIWRTHVRTHILPKCIHTMSAYFCVFISVFTCGMLHVDECLAAVGVVLLTDELPV